MVIYRSDNDSTAAEQDTDREDERWNDLDEGFQVGGDNSMDNDYEDDHALYSNAHEDGAFHIEDTTMMSDDPPAVDIDLPDDSHAKMD
jgi:hypothetical protein